MIINLVYLIIFLILIYVIYIAVKAINTGMQAKASNKLDENINTSNIDSQDNKSDSISDEITKLNYLLESEVITKEEFDKAKKKILDK
tara:strand:- start:378 stop:641 length:264 start_codon:yes stop_codon:yes gene_type:complete